MDRRRRQASQDYRDLVFSMAPVSYWRLGERSGTVARDEMGLNHGSHVGAPTLGVLGALAGDGDTAVTFNGTTQHVTIPTAGFPVGTADRTVSVWVEKVAASLGGLFTYGTASAGNWFSVFLAGATGSVYLSRNANDLNFGGTTNDGRRHHIVGVLTAGRTCSAFMDGVSLGPSQTFAGDPGAGAASGTIASTLGSNFLNGFVDEPAIWDRALTPAEIRALYDAGMGR